MGRLLRGILLAQDREDFLAEEIQLVGSRIERLLPRPRVALHIVHRKRMKSEDDEQFRLLASAQAGAGSFANEVWVLSCALDAMDPSLLWLERLSPDGNREV
ncbi:MAG: hypothetical protein ABI568_05120, partial [Pseudarthrobacter sp.]